MILVPSEELVAAIESRGGVDETVKSILAGSHTESGDVSRYSCKAAIEAVGGGVLGGQVEESRSRPGSVSKMEFS